MFKPAENKPTAFIKNVFSNQLPSIDHILFNCREILLARQRTCLHRPIVVPRSFC